MYFGAEDKYSNGMFSTIVIQILRDSEEQVSPTNPFTTDYLLHKRFETIRFEKDLVRSSVWILRLRAFEFDF